MSELQILGIPGSLRAGSWNAALLRLAQERAPQGVRVDIWEGLGAIPPFSEDHEILAPPPVEELRRAIAEADALLVATPEYNGGAPGQLKNAIDWASRPYGLAAVVGKPAGVISARTGSPTAGRSARGRRPRARSARACASARDPGSGRQRGAPRCTDGWGACRAPRPARPRRSCRGT